MPHISRPDVQKVDLTGHPNPWVRGTFAAILSMQQSPDQTLLKRLASDENKLVRIRVVYALEQIREAAPEVSECIASLLYTDQSAIVRAITAEVLASAS